MSCLFLVNGNMYCLWSSVFSSFSLCVWWLSIEMTISSDRPIRVPRKIHSRWKWYKRRTGTNIHRIQPFVLTICTHRKREWARERDTSINHSHVDQFCFSSVYCRKSSHLIIRTEPNLNGGRLDFTLGSGVRQNLQFSNVKFWNQIHRSKWFLF